MGKIDKNSVEGLNKIKSAFDKMFEERVSQVMVENSIKQIGKQGLLTLNELFKNTSVKLYETKNGKQLIKKYVKALKENKDLNFFYKLCNTIKNCDSAVDSSVFLNEAISLKKAKADKNSDKAVKELSKIVKECVREAKLTSNEIDNIINECKSGIDGDIEYILFENATVKNIEKYSNHLSSVRKHIDENKSNKGTITESENKSAKELISELDAALDSGTDELKEISLMRLSGKDTSEMFESTKKECIEILDEAINKEKDVEKSSRLLIMKNKLNEKAFNAETLAEDIVRLNDLKQTLLSD